jgi:ribose transport system ATP-binding protein
MKDVAAGAHIVSKRFGATTALDSVDFEVRPAEIHALVGENGAGKSTLVRILGGAVRPDEGRVTIGGRECRLASPHDAIVNGVITIPQELQLVPALSIAENLVLGAPPLRLVFGRLALVDRARAKKRARSSPPSISRPIPTCRYGRSASPSRRSFAKALRRRCRVLILD